MHPPDDAEADSPRHARDGNGGATAGGGRSEVKRRRAGSSHGEPRTKPPPRVRKPIPLAMRGTMQRYGRVKRFASGKKRESAIVSLPIRKIDERKEKKRWWRRRGLNPRPPRCERGALPTELLPHLEGHYTLPVVSPCQKKYFLTRADRGGKGNGMRAAAHAALTRADAGFSCIENPSVAPEARFMKNKYLWKFMYIPIDMQSLVSYHLDRFTKRGV
jgi:hypothetical protein